MTHSHDVTRTTSAQARSAVNEDEPTIAQPRAAPSLPRLTEPRRPPTKIPAPPPLPAAVRTSAAAPPQLETDDHLSTCLNLLRWLDLQLQRDGSREALRSRALVKMVLHEACSLLEQHSHAIAVAGAEETGTRPKARNA